MSMFGLFKKRDQAKQLQRKYRELLKRSYDLSTRDRAASDAVYAEAQEVLKQLEKREMGE